MTRQSEPHALFLTISFHKSAKSSQATRFSSTLYQPAIALVLLALMNIVESLLFCSIPDVSRLISQQRKTTMETFHNIFIDKFFLPITPFLEFVFKYRREIPDSRVSRSFEAILGELIKCSPFMEPMIQFVLSSSFALVFTDSLDFFNTDDNKGTLLKKMLEGLEQWKRIPPAAQKNGRQILARLRGEGLSDEI
ncbi:hypothetical protein BLNAU_3465 [Blattamonas nauphoetae]|uniref:Uncharacterized protein n=1 Tax=Blattamonas nauphoetae TaxID=2049346 RepID=A0ABQ9YD27_9EUKA|nr:hypothetical protein BLNAU_3465 [Blattamonas nauphoetae]